MSLTETHKHWLSGYWLCTADSRSVVKVAMPHLRGKWSPTKAILRIFVVSFKWNPLVTIFWTFFHRSIVVNALKNGGGHCSHGGVVRPELLTDSPIEAVGLS